MAIEVHYTERGFTRDYERTPPIDVFVSECVFLKSNRGVDEKAPLEVQPQLVAESLGRLLGVLIEKKLLSPDEFHDIISTDRVLRGRCEIKKVE